MSRCWLSACHLPRRQLITTRGFNGHEKHEDSQKEKRRGFQLFVTSCVFCGWKQIAHGVGSKTSRTECRAQKRQSLGCQGIQSFQRLVKVAAMQRTRELLSDERLNWPQESHFATRRVTSTLSRRRNPLRVSIYHSLSYSFGALPCDLTTMGCVIFESGGLTFSSVTVNCQSAPKS